MQAESPWTRVLFVVLTIAVMLAYGFVALRSVFVGPAVSIPLMPLKEPEEHVATEAMIRQAQAQAANEAPRIVATDGQGIEHDTNSDLVGRTLVLVFIKNGCPCSVAAQPFFERIATAFPGKVQFLGVIDGTPETARAWGEKYRAKMPILADPELKIVRDYGAESSVYVALIGPDRRIVHAWPGHSEPMLEELVGSIEKLTDQKAQALDFAEAPGTLMAGCPFDL